MCRKSKSQFYGGIPNFTGIIEEAVGTGLPKFQNIVIFAVYCPRGWHSVLHHI